jgi:hypothetical protein
MSSSLIAQNKVWMVLFYLDGKGKPFSKAFLQRRQDLVAKMPWQPVLPVMTVSLGQIFNG